jgi:hypothetical protein
VPICDESRGQNNGGRQCNKEEAPDFRQAFPTRKHAIPSPQISNPAQQARYKAEDYETPSMESLHVQAHGCKKRRKDNRSQHQPAPPGRLIHTAILCLASHMADSHRAASLSLARPLIQIGTAYDRGIRLGRLTQDEHRVAVTG